MRKRRITLDEALRCISAVSVISAASARSQSIDHRSTTDLLGTSFQKFITEISDPGSDVDRDQMTARLLNAIRKNGGPLMDDSTVHLVYHGDADSVRVPSDFNNWSPGRDRMKRVNGTSLFHITKRADPSARFEYKLVVDSAWTLDPLNPRKAMGGYGPNSEIWMPHYRPSDYIVQRRDVPRGKIDTLLFRSKLLGRSHPVYVYLPPSYKETRGTFRSIWVTDGGEYLSLGLMNTILDNLISAEKIPPVVGIFMDPRTDPRDSWTSTRMYDYTMSDTFVTAFTTELRDRIMKKYRVANDPRDTAIMGASLGGLIATYTAHRRPDVFGLCAAQSPAYWWNDGAIFNTLGTGKKIRFYIDTGTINDALNDSRRMKNLLMRRGHDVCYGEYPEGHNWVNWRARIDDILVCFFGEEQQ